MLDVPSRASVRRRSNEEGGEDTFDSSLENRLLPIGEFNEPCRRSVDSRRRLLGRDEGEFSV